MVNHSPRDLDRATTERVILCLEQVTRYPRAILAPDADLADGLGIDSIKQVEIALAIEREFGVRFDRTAPVRTIAEIVRLVERALGATTITTTTPASGPALDGAPAASRPSARSAPPLPEPRAPADHAPAPRGAPAAARALRPGSTPSVARPLEGRVALVTGSGRGLGRTVAELLAQRGATVVINSFHSRDAGERTALDIERAGGKAIHLWGSIANDEHVDEIFRQLDERFGGLDVLVCNASDGRIGPFSELTASDWDRAFRTNVAGHHACAIRAARLMAPRGGGSIVTMSAIGAHQYVQGLGCQGVVKAAVEALTRYLACELAPQAIRANCIAAGPVYGEVLDKLSGDDPGAVHRWEAMTPGGTLCDPLDIARAVAFLASDDAAAINGAVWTVDRGFSAHIDGRLHAPSIDRLRHTIGRAS
jgi:NAD(P)-dependent dehydrogenase (short-subunit alcohol dehydrogenase family)/acyl carrier protein